MEAAHQRRGSTDGEQWGSSEIRGGSLRGISFCHYTIQPDDLLSEIPEELLAVMRRREFIMLLICCL